jgi:uncharacterized protein (DUF1501 family)
LYGERPSLTNLDGGNLRHTTDFRSLYATVTEKWWGLSGRGLFGGKAPPLDLLKV